MTAVEYFGATRPREERATVDSYRLGLLVEAQAPEALRSLARWLGVSVTEALAIQDAGMVGQAIETRNAERRSAEARDRGDVLACDAFMRRRLIIQG